MSGPKARPLPFPVAIGSLWCPSCGEYSDGLDGEAIYVPGGGMAVELNGNYVAAFESGGFTTGPGSITTAVLLLETEARRKKPKPERKSPCSKTG